MEEGERKVGRDSMMEGKRKRGHCNQHHFHIACDVYEVFKKT